MESETVSRASRIEPIIKKAGELVLSYFRQVTTFKEKEEGGLLTEADLASERYLIEQLQSLVPGAAIIGEELGYNDGSNDYCWVIDPLDGTTNFVHGLPYFCISVALTYQGVPQFGAVYQPLNQEYFWAERGKGAFLNSTKIQVSQLSNLNQSVIVIGLPYKKEEHFMHLLDLIRMVAPKTFAFRHFGAVALDLAYVAAGRLDGIFFEDLSWWDVAAGMLLIEEAGGMVTDFEGNAIDEHYKTFVAAGSALFNPLRGLLLQKKS